MPDTEANMESEAWCGGRAWEVRDSPKLRGFAKTFDGGLQKRPEKPITTYSTRREEARTRTGRSFDRLPGQQLDAPGNWTLHSIAYRQKTLGRCQKGFTSTLSSSLSSHQKLNGVPRELIDPCILEGDEDFGVHGHF